MSNLQKHLRNLSAKLSAAQERATGEYEDLPDPDTRAYIDSQRDAARRKILEKAIPHRYALAVVADLDPKRQQSALVGGWLASDSPTLILTGAVGTGKTHAGWAIIREAVDQGIRSYGCTFADLLTAMRPGAFPSPAPRLAVDADLFLFDDLATARASEWGADQFGSIIDERTREGNRQIVTTNASSGELVERFGPRTVSRLAGGATIAEFTGDDLRTSIW